MALQTLTKPGPAEKTLDPASSTRKRPVNVPKAVATAVVAVLAAAWLVPFAWASLTALKTETEAAATPITWVPASGFTLDAFAKVLGSGNIPMWTFNSLFTSVAITFVTLVISALVGPKLAW